MNVADCGWNLSQVEVSGQLGGATMPWSPGHPVRWLVQRVERLRLACLVSYLCLI